MQQCAVTHTAISQCYKIRMEIVGRIVKITIQEDNTEVELIDLSISWSYLLIKSCKMRSADFQAAHPVHDIFLFIPLFCYGLFMFFEVKFTRGIKFYIG